MMSPIYTNAADMQKMITPLIGAIDGKYKSFLASYNEQKLLEELTEIGFAFQSISVFNQVVFDGIFDKSVFEVFSGSFPPKNKQIEKSQIEYLEMLLFIIISYFENYAFDQYFGERIKRIFTLSIDPNNIEQSNIKLRGQLNYGQ